MRNWLRAYDTRDDFFWGAYTPYSNLQCIIDLSHVDLSLLRGILGSSTFDRYFKFAVVRNPYDRTYSAFVESLKFFPEYKQRGFKAFLNEQLQSMHFDQRRVGGNQQVHFTPQSRYIYDDKGNRMLNGLCRIDRLETDLQKVADKLSLDLPNTLESRAVRAPPTVGRYQYMEHFDRECIDLVNQVYARDFKLLKYPVLKKPER